MTKACGRLASSQRPTVSFDFQVQLASVGMEAFLLLFSECSSVDRSFVETSYC